MKDEDIDTLLDGLNELKNIRDSYRARIITLDKLISRLEKIEELKR